MSATELWVVLDPAGEVVMMCSGADAGEVVEDWRARGYKVVLVADEVNAA